MNILVEKSRYENGLAVDFIASALTSVMGDIIHFIGHQITEFQPRDDYHELLHSSLLFLGAELSGGINIQAEKYGICR